MIVSTPALLAFESSYERDVVFGRSHRDALAIYSALWNEARQLNPSFGDDWEHSLEADRAIARAVNGVPPTR
jgi:hypothetical protein